MAESTIVTTLARKAGELSGIIAELERQIAQRRAELVHVHATLRMFDPDHELAAIPAKRPQVPRLAYFAMGELSQRCRDALREADGEPIAAEDIASKAIADKGLDIEDRKLRSDFIRRFLWALDRLNAEGTAERVGKGLGARWRLASKPGEQA